MKKLITLGLIMIFIGLIMTRFDDIVTIVNTYLFPGNNITLGEKNKYYREYDFEFVQNTDNFSPKNSQDILNIYYTIINAGKDEFFFYCPKEYKECLNEIGRLAKDQTKLSDINNYVHPYNAFSNIETKYDSFGKVTVKITKSYSNNDIKVINEKVDKLYNKLVNEKKSNTENIRTVHDYIINNSKYDSDRSDKNIIKYHSDIAYGPLFEGYAICGGYTDLMQLFLEKLKIKSYRISSDDHIWNAVYINGDWKHLDLTWDDPVVNDDKNYLQHEYFLITTNKLLSIETTQHIFNQERYKELKET